MYLLKLCRWQSYLVQAFWSISAICVLALTVQVFPRSYEWWCSVTMLSHLLCQLLYLSGWFFDYIVCLFYVFALKCIFLQVFFNTIRCTFSLIFPPWSQKCLRRVSFSTALWQTFVLPRVRIMPSNHLMSIVISTILSDSAPIVSTHQGFSILMAWAQGGLC